MIEIKNISYSYGRKVAKFYGHKIGKSHASKTGKEVLNDISFDVKPGECVGILGNNGVGKSTLITCICRIRTPNSGSVFINGCEIYNMTRNEMARQISYVAQKNEINQMTVFDSVLLGRKPYMRLSVSNNDINICEEIIKKIGISEFKLRYVNELSGGEQQKVMLARALVQQPKLLLLDEPTSNLDPKNQYEMLALVKKMAIESSTSVLIVLHDINLALRYCDRFLFLKSGRVHCYGDESIVTREVISDVYGVDSVVAQVEGRKVIVIG